jgi:hypothetical protein
MTKKPAFAHLGRASKVPDVPDAKTLDRAPNPHDEKAAAHEAATTAKTCNIGGVVGIVAANGVCVRLSGYVSAGFSAGHLK